MNDLIGVGEKYVSAADWSAFVQEMIGDHIAAALPKATSRQGLLKYTGGLVYFLDCEQYTKVGYTSGVIYDRVLNLESGNPFELKIWALVKGVPSDEQAMHKRLEPYKHRKEWFQLPPDVRRDLAKSIKKRKGEIYV